MRRVVLGLSAAIVLVGLWVWNKPESGPSGLDKSETFPAATSSTSAKTEENTAPSALAVTRPAQAVEAAELPASWSALLAGFSPEQQARLETLRARYPVAFEFASAEQFKWMLSHGYPHPADWLRTEELPEAELIRRAESGDLTAAAVGYDRTTNATEDLYQSTGELNRGASRLTAHTAMFEQTLGQACTPFLGYLRARNFAVNYPKEPYSVLPGYIYAATLGDQRADRYVQGHATALGIGREALAVAQISAVQYMMSLPSQCRYQPLPAAP